MANARLIASAPDLLEALRGLLGSMSLRQIDSKRINPAARKAMDAIAKATGEQP